MTYNKKYIYKKHTSIDLLLRRTPITEAVELISAFLCFRRIEPARARLPNQVLLLVLLLMQEVSRNA